MKEIFYKNFALAFLTVSIGMRVASAGGDAMVISGGGNPLSNNERYYRAIKMAHEVFGDSTVINAVADGGLGVGTPYIRNEKNGHPIKDDLGRYKTSFMPANKVVGGIQYPATKKGLRKAFLEMAKKKSDEPLKIYVSDHGSFGTDESTERAIVLWDQKLTASEFRELISFLPEKRKLILIQDQCYGGGMLESLFNSNEGELSLRPNSCGFAAARQDELAFSGGGVMETFLYAKRGTLAGNTFADAFVTTRDRSKKDNSYSDKAPYREYVMSSPVATSDLFVQKYLSQKNVDDKSPNSIVNCKKEDTGSEVDNLIADSHMVMLQLQLNKQAVKLKSNRTKCREKNLGFLKRQNSPEELGYRELAQIIGDQKSEMSMKAKHLKEKRQAAKEENKKLIEEFFGNTYFFKDYTRLKAEYEEQSQERVEQFNSPDWQAENIENFQKLEYQYLKKYKLAKMIIQSFEKLSPKQEAQLAQIYCHLFEKIKCQSNRKRIKIDNEFNKGFPNTKVAWLYKSYFKFLLEKNPKLKKEIDGDPKTLENMHIAQYSDLNLKWQEFNKNRSECRNYMDTLGHITAIKQMISTNDNEVIKKYLGIVECEETTI